MKYKRRKFFLALCALLTAIMVIACGSAPAKESRSLGDGVAIDAANAQLAKVPVVGFPPFTTKMPITQFDQYGENAATVAKTVIASMPEGYLLQIVGHANQHPSKSAAFTKSLSTQRARTSATAPAASASASARRARCRWRSRRRWRRRARAS